MVARPFFARLLSDMQALREENAVLNQRLTTVASAASQIAVSATSQVVVSATDEELRHLARMFDSLRKDQMACNHRLGSLEDSVEDGKAQWREASQLAQVWREQDQRSQAYQDLLSTRVDALEHDVASERTKATGILTLARNTPMAVFGTSLVLHDGPYGRFVLRQPDLISDYILGGAFWDSHLKKIIEDATAADRTAIDAGSYLGFHSVYMSRFFRTVYAFEPQVEIYRMLCANLLLNGCHNVVASNHALYDSPGHMRLADGVSQEIAVPARDGEVDYDHIGNAAAMSFQLAQKSEPSAVESRTIDQMELPDVALIKVDTQGSDLRVLQGARRTLMRCKPVIAAEYERELARNHGSSLEDFYSFFSAIGYDVATVREQSDGKQLDLLATPR